MHELSLTKNLVKICEGKAAGRKVVSITVEIGELSGVMPEAMAFCFDNCTRGTAIDGAILRLERVAAQGRCQECDAQYSLLTFYGTCPACGGNRMEIISGEEMRVKNMEVE